MKYSGGLGRCSVLGVEENLLVLSLNGFKLYDLKKNEQIEIRIADCFPRFLDLMIPGINGGF